MKGKILVLLFVISLISCNNDDGNNNNNQFLNPPPISLNLSLSLPEYNPLNFDGNTVVLPSAGIKGIIVYRQSESQIFAFELSDPNHTPSSCSAMDVNGLIATCPCTSDENEYALALFGVHQSNQELFPMLQYNVQKTSGNIIISN